MPGSPLVPHPHDVRASDAERESLVDTLREHAAAGRIDADELERRIERAYAAQLRADLVPLVADLPSAEPRPVRPPRSLPAFSPVIALAVLLIAIWALTGAGYFWPIWPIGGVAIGALKHGRRHQLWPPVRVLQ
jgi:Domain of unknown function (DUF1707)